jgi:hypothetical protein
MEEVYMKKLLIALAALPFAAGAASAAQPLTNQEMDQVTAGFEAISFADAQALGKIVAAASATLSQVAVVTTVNSAGVTVPVTATFGETTLTLIKSLAAAQSASSATNALPTFPIGLSDPTVPAP